MNHSRFIRFPLILLITFFISSCATSEDTILVVDQAPSQSKSESQQDEDVEEEFRQITLGLIDPVTNFDPLYARTLSEKRIISLIYESLLTLDKDGTPTPSVANEIDVSDNGLVYTIHINRNLFYHDSPVFTAGIGRRIHAADVKWAFERTAKANVPPNAAMLLMNIKGYENYYLEQRSLYDNERRVLEEVTGIQTIDAETVQIELTEPDSLFMDKLASPYLSIYPREAVLNNPETLSQKPVGTGYYLLTRVEDGGRIILTRNDSENGRDRTNKPDINRIDAVYYGQETSLFQDFARGDIDWIPEIGPEMKQQVLTDDNQIDPAYADAYEAVVHPIERTTAFYLNPRSTISTDWLRSKLSLLTSEDFIRGEDISLHVEDFTVNEDAEPEENYYVMLTDNLYARSTLSQLHNLIFLPESSLVFYDIRVPTRTTSIYTKSSDSIHSVWNPITDNFWLQINSKIVSLTNGHVQQKNPSQVPWLLHLHDLEFGNND